MSVRCKLQLVEKADMFDGYTNKRSSTKIRFAAVSGPENKTWSTWTPGGTFELYINNPAALDQFQLGQTYFVDFTPAPLKESDEK